MDMGNIDEYYKVFTTETEEEIRLGKEIDAENERFEKLPETKAHYDKIHELLKERSKIFNERLEKAREVRKTFRRKANPTAVVEKKPIENSKELESAIEAVRNLDTREQLILSREVFCEKIPDGKEKMDEETVKELHEVLVQTVLDFINEKGLKNVWSVSFSADSLQESAEFGTWCPATDSFLNVEGLETEEYKSEDGKTHSVPHRVSIGESY